MRYPDIPIMARFFDLVRKRLKMGDKLLPVTMSHGRNVLHFNGVRVTKENVKPPFTGVDTFKVGISERNLLYYNAIHPLREYFVSDTFSNGLKKLLEKDEHSVRSYLALEKRYPAPVINWLETMEWRTGTFDASLMETVIASLSFRDPKSEKEGKQVDWLRLKLVHLSSSGVECELTDCLVYTAGALRFFPMPCAKS
jgi:hypothetical protein